jgi:1-acyl-sn-glycerol-3-phosphate acyltransferase
MVRRIIIALLRLALRIFFRHLEVVGRERVPRDAPVMFVLNHPNALVDPAFLLCLAPRRVSFLAKAPIFKMPFIGWLARELEALPVYRRQDKGADMSRNQETFKAARELLKRGGTIGICPEGISHNERRLMPLKTGAARIALGAVSAGQKRMKLFIVPAGLYYTAKARFRSSVLLYFGEPMLVEPVTPDENGEPQGEAVDALTERLQTAMRQVMLDAENEEAFNAVQRAESIFSSAEETNTSKMPLEKELRRRQRFLAGYAYLRRNAPERVETLLARIRRYEEDLHNAGLDPEELSPPSSAAAVLRQLACRLVVFSLLIVPALIGLTLHYPAYLLIDLIVMGFIKDDAQDMESTVKIIGALLLFPLTWLVLAILGGYFVGWWLALAVLALVPLTGWAAVRFFEKLDQFVGSCRAVIYFVTRRWYFVRLLAERQAIREEILSLGNEAAQATQSQ